MLVGVVVFCPVGVRRLHCFGLKGDEEKIVSDRREMRIDWR